MRTAALKIDREALLAQSLRGAFPDARGRFGPFGGRYVPETLVPALDRLAQAFVAPALQDLAQPFLDFRVQGHEREFVLGGRRIIVNVVNLKMPVFPRGKSSARQAVAWLSQTAGIDQVSLADAPQRRNVGMTQEDDVGVNPLQFGTQGALRCRRNVQSPH